VGSPKTPDAQVSDGTSSKSQSPIRPLLPLGVLWLTAIAALGFIVLQRSVPQKLLLFNPSTIAEAPWYLGLLWSVEVIGWTSATVAAFLGSRICALGNRAGASRMLRDGTILSFLLLMNQLIRVDILPGTIRTMPVIHLMGLVFVLWWFHTASDELRRTRFELLIAAVAALSFGAFLSLIGLKPFGVDEDRLSLATSTLSLIGVLAWAQYFILTVYDISRSILVQLQRDTPHPKTTESQDPTLTKTGL